MSKDLKNIWVGIYKDFSEAQVDDGVFLSNEWLDKQVNRIKDMRRDGNSLSMTTAYALTPILSTMVDGCNTIRVLDFGGGLGTEYLSAISGLEEKNSVDFTIVDNTMICEVGSQLFMDDENMHFSVNMLDKQNTFDLVHAGSSIQYVDDWKSLLETFSGYEPQYIILSEVMAGANPSFVTVQQWYGKGIPVRFLNITELQTYMRKLRYELILCQNFTSKSNGNGNPLPMDNFPSEYQVEYSKNLVFKYV